MYGISPLTQIANIIRITRQELALDNLRAFASDMLDVAGWNPHKLIHIGGWQFKSMAWYEQNYAPMFRDEAKRKASQNDTLFWTGD